MKETLMKPDWQVAAPPIAQKANEWYARLYGVVTQRRLLREYLAVGALLAVTLAVRLALAARGWPHTGSDEATEGLMADDILWHHAHPIFFYGQDYLGSLQAYLIAPFFAVFGSTNFVMHVVTTLQILLFLVVFYAFIRAVFSPLAAIGSLALLAFGPSEALLYELRAGGHSQDLFLFGSLMMWLVVLRLRRAWSTRGKLVLAGAIGATMGLGFWGTFLILPFVAGALLALGIETIRRGGGTPLVSRLRQIRSQLVALTLSIGISVIPFIIGLIASGGNTIHQVFGAVTSNGHAAQAGIPQQALGTFVVGLPILLGRDAVCASCGYWPAPIDPASAVLALRDILVALPFDLIAIGFWVLAAYPLGRNAWQVIHHWRQHGTLAGAAPAGTFDARWWGRCMLVAGGALTFGAFIISKSSYITPQFSNRYIMGLYLCTPLVVDPLMHGARNLWNWFVQREHFPARTKVLAVLAVLLFAALQITNILGFLYNYQQTRDRTFFGVPSGSRDAQLIAFLERHGSTKFYTTYWICNQVMFEASEHVICAVVDNFKAFAVGQNRSPTAPAQVKQAQHPAYVFDMTTNEADPGMLRQMATALNGGDPHLRGYRTAIVDGYLVYYAGG